MAEDIYSDESLWDVDVGNHCDPLDYECPKCGPWGLFIFDEEDLTHHGFSKSSAMHGICVNCAWLGNTEIDSKSILDLEKFSSENRITNASKLIFAPKTESEKQRLMLVSPYYDLGANKAAKYRVKSLYRSAIKEHRYRMMDPPYFVGDRTAFLKADYDSEGKKSEVDPEKDTYVSTNHDWFLSLFESFKDLETYLRKADRSIAKPNRLSYALITTFLHKHWDFRNVEPLWVFMKRMNIGHIQITRRMNTWITPTPSRHITQIDSLSLPATMASISNLISIISSHAKDVKLSENEVLDMENNSIAILKKLQNKIITDQRIVSEPKSLLDHLTSKAQFSGSVHINGKQFHASGLIEALCVNQSAYMVLDSRKAKNLEKKFLFPADHGTPWWRRELTDEANKTINDFSKYVELLDTT